MIRSSLGEVPSGRSAQNACKTLYDLGLLDRLWHGGKYRYMVTSKGVVCLSRRDRVHYAHCKDRINSLSWVNRPSLRKHEDGVMFCMGAFLEGGLPVASGWRSWEHLGRLGGISPDGLVFLPASPFGSTWACFEYERTARGEARVQRKLRGYSARLRENSWPVLFVCWDDAAESVFHQVGGSWDIPMLTTTVARLEGLGALGNDGCWSMYGEPVSVGLDARG